MGILGVVRDNRWTPAEVEELRKLAGVKSSREIALIIGRGKSGVCQKMSRLGIKGVKPGRQHTWTEVDFEDLRNVQIGVSSNEFARTHGRSGESVRFWARKLGVQFRCNLGLIPQEVERLRELAKTCSVQQVAECEPMTVKGLRHLAGRHGFKFQSGRTQAAPRVLKQPRARVSCIKPKRTKVRKFSVYAAPIEYCPVCHAPVSNWQQHFERQGHRRTA